MHILLSLTLILFSALSIILIVFSLHLGIAPMPTSRKVKELLWAHFPDIEGKIETKIADLGAGWGHLCIPLARRYPHLTIEAYEFSPVPYLFLRALKIILGIPNLKIIRRNFLKVSLNATIYVCYLYPGIMKKLEKKFERECSTSIEIISNTFAMPGWTPYKTLTADDLYRSKIYFYTFSGSLQKSDC